MKVIDWVKKTKLEYEIKCVLNKTRRPRLFFDAVLFLIDVGIHVFAYLVRFAKFIYSSLFVLNNA